MNLTSPTEIRLLLEELRLAPSKALGQNFLVDRNILDIILDAADIRATDQILEIGPGLGVLTEPLVASAARVIAVEKDKGLYEHLRTHFAAATQLELIHDDALHLDLGHLFTHGINKIVANPPYSIGTRFLVDAFTADMPPDRIVVTVQEEVAARLAAKPNTKDYGLLGILAKAAYDVRIRKAVSMNCFYPRPKVGSAVVCLTRTGAAPLPWKLRKALLHVVKGAFSQRRKQVLNALARPPGQEPRPVPALRTLLAELHIEPGARPEAVTVAQWIRLTQALSRKG